MTFDDDTGFETFNSKNDQGTDTIIEPVMEDD